MNTKKLCKVLLMAACACCLAGCGDDNDAISLVNTQGNELITNNGTYFKLSPFSSGDTFIFLEATELIPSRTQTRRWSASRTTDKPSRSTPSDQVPAKSQFKTIRVIYIH